MYKEESNFGQRVEIDVSVDFYFFFLQFFFFFFLGILRITEDNWILGKSLM